MPPVVTAAGGSENASNQQFSQPTPRGGKSRGCRRVPPKWNSIVKQNIAHVAIVVRDYDEAIAFYTTVMGFKLMEDMVLGGGKRWVVVAPQNSTGTALLLACAATPEQESRIGNQTGGRVFLFLHTDDFWGDYHAMRAHGVTFETEPRQEAYGTVAVFDDLYGNRWDLIERV
jgi:catechol 2,3-dioxygenase-like lactoylglutathione lyase family enzyme